MKKIKPLLILLLPIMVLLSGCPMGIAYPLAEQGSEKADKSITGKWETGRYGSPFKKMKIKKGRKNSLKVKVDDVTDEYDLSTKKFTVWTTVIDDNKFLFAQPKNIEKEVYYMYRYEMVDGKLYTYDITMSDEEKKKINSTEALRAKIKEMIKNNKVSKVETVWHKK